ncbi:MAG TPA: hypothetical protein VFD58_33265 [Blastocatellia bacterium]|nr:hypothetical protein [Blastocatellia bacterium]
MCKLSKGSIFFSCCLSVFLAALFFVTTVSAQTPLGLSGTVTNLTQATGTTAGSITVGGVTLPIAPGTTVSGVNTGSVVTNLAATVNTTGQITSLTNLGTGTTANVSLCGVIQSLTQATGSSPGSVTINGVTLAIAPGTSLGALATVGANLCLLGTLNAAGQINSLNSVAANIGSTINLCGPISALTQATATTPGSITIGGVPLVIAPGATLTGIGSVGSSLCAVGNLNASGQITSLTNVGATANSTINLCGVVSALTQATAGAPGLITIGGVPLVIAPGTSLGGAATVGSNLCALGSLNAQGQLTGLNSVSANVGASLNLCGIITALTNATATTPGSVTIGGITLPLAPGTSAAALGAVGANICANANLNALGQITNLSQITANVNVSALICGVVTAFTAATATLPGSITIGGVTIPIAPGVTLAGQGLITVGANLCLNQVIIPPPGGGTGPGQLGPGSGVVTGPGTPTCPQILIPALTHGFGNAADDLFLLQTPFSLLVTSPPAAGGSVPGFNIFNVNAANFGGTPAQVSLLPGFGAPGFGLTGFGFSTPNGKLTAISCIDNFWDIPFEIASSGTTVGDMITFFAQNPDGTGQFNLGVFTVEAGGVRVTSLNPNLLLFRNDILAHGGGVPVGTLIPFSNGAGTAGARTDLLLLAFAMTPTSPFNNCLEFGLTVMRGGGTGTISLVIPDIIVNRAELPGDRTRNATGVFLGQIGGFATGVFCPSVICPICPPNAGSGGGPVTPLKCQTICFGSPLFFRNSITRGTLPDGLILLPGVNFNNMVSVGANDDAIDLILRGGSTFGVTLSPVQRFNQEFVAAQLSLLRASGGPVVTVNILWTNLSCYGITFAPVTLSNGVVLTPDSMLKDLFMQAGIVARSSTATNSDRTALANIFDLLNGPGNRLTSCRTVQ